MLLVIDNYDSFTYNLVQYLGELKAEVEVVRNDQVSVDEILHNNASHIMISPGPCTPKEAGVSNEIIKTFSGKKPVLGVCLGHQCIGHVFGGEIVRAKSIMHGKTSDIKHNNDPLYKGLENPFQATRYHTLIIEKKSLPKDLKINAWTSKGEIMGVKHKKHPTWGVQFHPESIMTPEGKQLLKNFLKL